jgi:hypothetical protein
VVAIFLDVDELVPSRAAGYILNQLAAVGAIHRAVRVEGVIGGGAVGALPSFSLWLTLKHGHLSQVARSKPGCFVS